VAEKEKIMNILSNKITGVKRLLPVGKDHINYLESELVTMIDESVQER
jgi:hypothetical protein